MRTSTAPRARVYAWAGVLGLVGIMGYIFYTLRAPGQAYRDLLAHAIHTPPPLQGLSPDGKWILMAQGAGDPLAYMPLVMAAHGRQEIKWPVNYGYATGLGFWLPDSRHWAMLERRGTGDTLVINGLNGSVRRIPLMLPDGEELVGFTPQGKAVCTSTEAWNPTINPANTHPVSVVDLSAAPAKVTTFQVPNPKQDDPQYGRVSLSPRGDRLAWVYFSSRPNTLGQWLSLRFRHGYAGGITSVDIWTSALNGSPPQELGQASGRQVSFPSDVHWTPDGQSIVVSVNGTIYSVPAM